MTEIIGIDVGGTKIHGIRMDCKNTVKTEIKVLTEAEKGFEHSMNKIYEVIESLLTENVEGIGIGIAGPVNYKEGKVIECPNIPGWQNIELKKIIEEKYNLKVAVENDAKCFAIAEHQVGAGKGLQHMVGITLGTGIGGGLIINGSIYRGRDNIAGEIGHTTMFVNREQFPNEPQYSFEHFASGSSILKRALEHIENKTIQTQLKAENLTPRDIYSAALRDKDPLAVRIIEDTGTYLGIGIANIMNTLNPEMIVFGGSVSRNLPLFEKTMRKAIQERAFSPGNDIPIRISQLDYPGTIGAALIVNPLACNL